MWKRLKPWLVLLSTALPIYLLCFLVVLAPFSGYDPLTWLFSAATIFWMPIYRGTLGIWIFATLLFLIVYPTFIGALWYRQRQREKRKRDA